MREVEMKSINTIRMLSVDQIEKAKSGHPGICMGAAPMTYTLFNKHMNINPDNSQWFNRDRFILSAGHGSALLYSMLHLSGFDVSIDDLKQFRQLNSKTPGHPEVGHTPGVEATSGPLGQGIAQAVGMAMAEKHLAAKYNKEGLDIVDHYTYAIVGDGDLMEGVANEAISLAGHLGLGKLVVLYDSNDICLDGKLSTSFSENVIDRVKGMNWHTIRVEDGDRNIEAISAAIEEAKSVTDKPTLIEVKTTIGYGSPNKGGTNGVHGAPLGSNEYEETKANLNWTYDPFTVPNEVKEDFANNLISRGKQKESEWNELVNKYKESYPEEYNSLISSINGELNINFEEVLPRYEIGQSVSTRNASGFTMNAIAKSYGNFFGGSADLAHSNMTYLNDQGDFRKDTPDGKNIWFGVREFGMSSAGNGIMLHGGLRAFVSTFFVFSDYLKPAIRMSAIEKLPLVYVLTHDSIAVGEDGPTHEPIEQLAGLRAIPNVNVIRPADAHETNAAWQIALENKETPSVLVLSRQNINVNAEFNCVDNVRKGAYIISEAAQTPVAQIVATGSEVDLAINSQKELEKQGIYVDVVSMPCFRLFDIQDEAYKNSVLKPGVKKLAVEMASSYGWHKYVDEVLCIDTFGASGNGNEVMNFFGFNKETVVDKVKELI